MTCRIGDTQNTGRLHTACITSGACGRRHSHTLLTVKRRAHRLGLVLLLGGAAWHGGQAAWIEAKAHLAQHLVRRAWRQAQAGATDARPWPWADTHPVARLTVPGQGVDLFVLAGASGRTLAFGPGHLTGTPLPGERGNAVVSGHRDTHFAFLRRLRPGEVILVEGRGGERWRFEVSETRVVDRRELSVVTDAGDTRLTLVTCYPFNALRPGGPQRYVVTARLLPSAGPSEPPAKGGTSPELARTPIHEVRLN